ncbi:cupin domain-containing protein [Salipaludibacillus aurantiacus]|uniref:Cupin domain-containing protein n=1 Tax=Salipaludibacillus aurantiacus TaxID=1601833 RepID=A0A1H9UDC0_9BACI|nr:cupin domain-containing protein [Salipaludibacillus aurantiacus]SES07248.1 Cupin domain-containing protein [Salipaludibacillus aurantiacus]
MVKRNVLSAEGSLMVVKVEIEAGFEGDTDQHPEEQTCYLEKGKLEFDLAGDKKILNEGDTQYVPSNEKHRVKVLEDCVIIDVFSPVRQDLLDT